MLSYRHGFHAGNHADVLKHVVLIHLLTYLIQKDKPVWFVDTHAGAGQYALDQGYATKNAEFETGIARLWTAADLPAPIAAYLAQIRAANPGTRLTQYPGSPQIAAQMLREHDRLRLFELHSTEIGVLQGRYDQDAPRVIAQAGDGFDSLRSVLPPPSRRGLILIDPSYEDKQDYRRVLDATADGLKRFGTGVYAIWYPQVQRPESRRLPEQLKRLHPSNWLHVALTAKAPVAGGLGLHGSGMVVLNPPWTLRQALEASMPYLRDHLRQDDAATYLLEAEIP